MTAAKVTHASGKRKEAVARATVRPGQGQVKINNIPIDIWTPEFAKLRIQEPLIIAGPLAADVNIDVAVCGGGWSSQAEAARLAIAKSLVAYTGSEQLKKMFIAYDRFLLVADTRRKEARKFGTHSRARAKRQTSYR